MFEDSERSLRAPSRANLLKVVILGDGGVGKSCLMNRFVSNQFDEHCFHTIGVEFMNKTLEVGGTQYTLQVWDTAGQERFKSLRTPFYRGSDVCLLAYAVDDRASFRSLRAWLDEFLHYADVRRSRNAFPFIVLGNKSDMPEREREVTPEELRAWCEENKLTTYLETSAKNNTNVKEAFELAVQRWIESEQQAESELNALEHSDTVHLDTRADRIGSRMPCCVRYTNEL